MKGLEASLSKIVMKSAPVQEKKEMHMVIYHSSTKTISKPLLIYQKQSNSWRVTKVKWLKSEL